MELMSRNSSPREQIAHSCCSRSARGPRGSLPMRLLSGTGSDRSGFGVRSSNSNIAWRSHYSKQSLACLLSLQQCKVKSNSSTRSSNTQNGSLVRPPSKRMVCAFSLGRKWTKYRGVTPIGRATVSALKMNTLVQQVARRLWITAGVHPPGD